MAVKDLMASRIPVQRQIVIILMNTKHFLSVSLLFARAYDDRGTATSRDRSCYAKGQGGAASPNAFIKFDLDFPGGRPKTLSLAIQKASGHALNTLVPDEWADTTLLRSQNEEC